MENLPCLTDLTGAQLRAVVTRLGGPAYRARQLQRWLYQGLATSYDEMADLPQAFRDTLSREYRLHSLSPLREVVSRRDGTRKALLALADGNTIEAALMPYPAAAGKPRHTVCLSTQAGCPIGCPFCATGQQGFTRNLKPGEIIDQALYFARQLRDSDDGSVTNLVFMGMGEPLANYEALWQAVGMLNSPEGFGLGARHMTISTSGLVPGIKRLIEEKLQVGLAISLHASEDQLRDRLVPINKKYPLEELIPACAEYFERTGRRPSFEYILFRGLNDSPEQARSLAHLLQGLNCHVNLIPANPAAARGFSPSSPAAVRAFQTELTRCGMNHTIRQSMGVDIDAGCGQLRGRFLQVALD